MMNSQLRGRRSGPLWLFVLLLVIAALAIGYFFGAQRTGDSLFPSAAQVSASPTWTPTLAATSVAIAIVTTLDTPTAAATATPDLAMVQTVVAAQLASAMSATLTAQPTPDQAATATRDAALVSTAVVATLAAQPTAISGGISSNSHSCSGVVQTQLTSLREGPGTYYPTISTVRSGDLLLLIGRTESTSWFKIQMPDSTDMRERWIRADMITVQAGCTLPEIAPTTATSAP